MSPRLEELTERFRNEPLGKFLNATLKKLEEGKATVFVAVRPEYLIVDGIVQGGITTVVADFAGIYAAMAQIPAGHTPCTHISIYFIRPVREGEFIEAVAQVEHEGKTSMIVRVDVYGAGGKRKAYGIFQFAKPKA